MERELLDAGVVLEPDKNRRKQTLEAVAKTRPLEDWIYEDHTGWIENGTAFVTTNGVIGNVTTKIVGVNAAKSINDRSGKLSTAGGWKAWCDGVAEPARRSTTLMFSISAALGAPLLGLAGVSSFSLNLFGPTRAGKNFATATAGSVIGIGRAEDLISWKITNARLEERIPEFNDMLFPIDDLDKMKGKKKDKYERLRELAYSISDGAATAHHSSWTTQHEGAHKTRSEERRV